MKPTKPLFDNHHANIEGWAVFDDGEIQRLDGGPIVDGNQTGVETFQSDEQAREFVKKLAAAGSAYHAEAIDIERQWRIEVATRDPRYCPFCGNENIVFVNGFQMRVVTDPDHAYDDMIDLDEYQCRGCHGRSFWV